MEKIFFEDKNPFNGEIIKEIESSNEENIKKKVEDARCAFFKWSNLDVYTRVSMLRPISEGIEKHKDELSILISKEVGKPIKEARNEVLSTINEVNWYLDHGIGFLSENVIHEDDNKKDILVREPWGVAAVICPFNVPLEISMWGIMPNLISGNTVVFKPSEYTPLVGQKIYELFLEIGLDNGLINIVNGDGEVGKALVESNVDFVWFTGSSKVGQEVFATCGKRFINSVMELGGSNATIIFDDVNVDDKLISDICFGRFFNCGQVCSAIKRLFVHENIYDEFLDKFVKKVKSLVVGDPMDDTTDIGTLISELQLKVLKDQVQDAIEKGAKVECGGKGPENFKNGVFYLPTVLTNISKDMKVSHEEIFGPVLPITKFKDENKALELINNTEYGLSSEIYTNDIEKAKRLALKIDAGRVAINMPRFASLDCPMGGYKKSGKGREHGKWIFEELTQLKHIMIKK